MKRILLIEDEDVILKALTRLLERNHYSVTTATTVEAASDLHPSSFDLILADLRLPGAPGTAIIPAADPVPVIIMTSHASVRSAVDAMRSGAIDYIAKPFDHDELLMIIGRSLMHTQLHAQNRALKLDLDRLIPIVHYLDHELTDSIVQPVSENNGECHLHLFGEQGTNREHIARAVHARGKRSDVPFVVLDTNTIDKSSEMDTLSEYLQVARNGTLLIRHPENLSAAAQSQLAGSLLLESEKTPPNSTSNHFNIVLTTLSTSSLDELHADTLINDELKALLKIERCIPPLRQRREDILPLAQQTISREWVNVDKPAPTFNDDAQAVLKAHNWPGNIAELEHRIIHAINKTTGNSIDVHALGFDDSLDGIGSLGLDAYFRYAVIRHQGQLSETELAAMLGISRKALWERRQKMHLLRTTGDS